MEETPTKKELVFPFRVNKEVSKLLFNLKVTPTSIRGDPSLCVSSQNLLLHTLREPRTDPVSLTVLSHRLHLGKGPSTYDRRA